MARIRRSDIPEFYCPIDVALNKHTELAEKHSLQWVEKFGLIPKGGKEYQGLRSAKAACCVGYTNPDASVDDLCLMSDWIIWVFTYDDVCDSSDLGNNPNELSAMNNQLLDVLNGAEVTQQDNNFVQALQDIRQRLIQKTSKEWVERFAHDVDQQLQGYIWEATNRLEKITPDLSTYVKLRPYPLVIFPCLDLTWISKHIPVNAKFLIHIYVQNMAVMASNYVGWTNDILGVNRELDEGNPHNIVLVLQQEYNLSLQDAVQQAVQMCNAEMKAFLNLESHLPSFGEAEDASLKDYINGLRSWMGGHFVWYSEIRRYNV
ncbi:hypothetical protein BJP36_20925 [Moorena producens JHB]|uniref:Terpene synthase n=1 Tax=Moorena producens (strain JHB) TaxID=1454205 RepID=A0A1D9G2Z1_MOOP1|nr:hypothetical protein [Moorena producens]AOY81997.1 hypothetical protein BJP36_20925 [Moorena producens JHB]